jgi:hypothetical protein
MTISQALIDKVAESQFQGMPDWQVADVLNLPDASLAYVKTDVSTSDVKQILLSSLKWAAIVKAAGSTSIDQNIRDVCIVVRDTFKETSTIVTTDPDIFAATDGALSALLAEQIISQGVYDALIALTNRRPSWAEHNNLPTITARDVGLARGGVA